MSDFHRYANGKAERPLAAIVAEASTADLLAGLASANGALVRFSITGLPRAAMAQRDRWINVFDATCEELAKRIDKVEAK